MGLRPVLTYIKDGLTSKEYPTAVDVQITIPIDIGTELRRAANVYVGTFFNKNVTAMPYEQLMSLIMNHLWKNAGLSTGQRNVMWEAFRKLGSEDKECSLSIRLPYLVFSKFRQSMLGMEKTDTCLTRLIHVRTLAEWVEDPAIPND